MTEKKLDLGNVVGAAVGAVEAAPTQAITTEPPKPRQPSPGLLQKMTEAVAAYDTHREAEARATALKNELFLTMKAEGIDEIPFPGRGPVKIERGEECKAASQGILKANLTAEDAEKVWKATKKSYERLSIPKAPDVQEPSQ